MFNFTIKARDDNSQARVGELHTPHGVINTPAFVPVATKGALRGVDFTEAAEFKAQVFMINTYHFFQTNTHLTVKKFGGLHRFLNINYPLMTDSGGFQVFSLGLGREHGVGKVMGFIPGPAVNRSVSSGRNLAHITAAGVEFCSAKDGRRLFMDPAISIQAQKDLGADFIFAFDECTSPLADYNYTKESLERTHRWAEQSLQAFGRTKKQALFGIIQGGPFRDLREESTRVITALPFFGFGIGGAMGETKTSMHQVLDWITPMMPEDKPRHLLGLGEPDDILAGVERGLDTFDCVIPTRWARHGLALSSQGRYNLRSAKYLADRKAIDQNCSCPVCQQYSRGYLTHLLREKEVLGIILLTRHNLYWLLNLMADIREAIKAGQFRKFKKDTLKKLKR